ncbi:hypothetical protein ACRTEC_00930 [Janibacter indicus]
MTTTQRRSPVPGMRRGVLVSGLCGTVALTIAGAVAKGADGALSALAGALLSFVVMLLGLLAISAVVAGDPGASMAGAGLVFMGQLIILVAAIALLRQQPSLDGPVIAAAAIVEVVLIQVGQLRGYVRARHAIDPQAGRA